MKPFRISFALLIALSSASFTEAQQPMGEPQGVEALRQASSSKTEFALDHSMLVLASKLDSNDDDLRRVIAGVSGLSVHRYRFAEAWGYDPAILLSMRDEYHAAGWEQLVNNHDKHGPGATDLWVHLQNSAVSNIAILVARSNEVTLIEISGSISPIDLIHLGGHFGIPRIEGGATIPNVRR